MNGLVFIQNILKFFFSPKNWRVWTEFFCTYQDRLTNISVLFCNTEILIPNPNNFFLEINLDSLIFLFVKLNLKLMYLYCGRLITHSMKERILRLFLLSCKHLRNREKRFKLITELPQAIFIYYICLQIKKKIKIRYWDFLKMLSTFFTIFFWEIRR